MRCLRLTKRSLLRTSPLILMTSQAMSSWRILTAWGAGTLRDNSLIRSRALSTAAGSYVFRVVLTVMLPSTKSRVQAMPIFSSERVISGHDALRYVSRYLGKRTEKEDSSLKVPPKLSSGLNSSIFHLSTSSVSHGLSTLCVEGISAVLCDEWRPH